LPELLVVLAVVALIASVIFPVFRGVQDQAKKATCISNFKQVSYATLLYLQDYDDRFMPVNHRPGSFSESSLADRTWVQLLLPYVRSFSVFQCPSDPNPRSSEGTVFDQDLVPGDTFSRYFRASIRSNVGYNYLYLSPVIQQSGTWVAQPRVHSTIANPTRTLVFADSAGEGADGLALGGGSWLVVPPCRYEVAANGRVIDTFTGTLSGQVQVFAVADGWDPDGIDGDQFYGGAWPWHHSRVNIARADGGVESVHLDRLHDGCDLKHGWGGRIVSPDNYLWDTR
jgi:type II secretory pathway pseudopilin PulG